MDLDAYTLALEIVEKTRDSYEAAWSHLVWMLSILGIVVGIVVPAALEIFRRYYAKADLGKTKAELRTELHELLRAGFAESVKHVGDSSKELQAFVFEQHDRFNYRLHLLENQPELAASIALDLLKKHPPPNDSRAIEASLKDLSQALARCPPGAHLAWLLGGNFVVEARKLLTSTPFDRSPSAALVLKEIERISRPNYLEPEPQRSSE